MDNSTVSESIAADGFLHWQIVSMGVNTKMVNFTMAEIKAGPGNAFRLAVGGNPVDGAVRLIGVPGAIFDDGIIRFSSYNKGEASDNLVRLVIRRADIVIVMGDILQDIFGCRIITSPLGWIAVGSHKLSGIGVEGHNIVYIFFLGKSYMNHCVITFLSSIKNNYNNRWISMEMSTIIFGHLELGIIKRKKNMLVNFLVSLKKHKKLALAY